MQKRSSRMEMTVEFDVPIAMRDGVRTFVDVYRPRDEERHPVLLTRTPYDKSGGGGFPSPLRGVQRGYVVAVQDVRGRYKSEGEFSPLFQEIDDGYDSVEWCAAQSWSDGNVGMHGPSYLGATQWLAAIAGPPHLKTIAPIMTPFNYYAEWVYRAGAMQLQFVKHWLINHSPEVEARDPWPREGRTGPFADIESVYETAYRSIPTKDLPLSWGDKVLKEWVRHPRYDRYWEQIDIGRHLPKVAVPALIFGGWYDFFLQGSLDSFERIRSTGATKESRSSQLIVGPWNHGIPSEFSFGDKADWNTMGMESIILRWFDRWVKGLENGVEKDPAVRVFVMGDGVWRTESRWPVSRARPTRFYLHSAGDANSVRGDGSLTTAPPGKEEHDRFVYDPLDPVPTIGQDMVGRSTYPAEGPHDQSKAEGRMDVLVYSTPPLDREIEVTGRIWMKLFASTSALDTDFTAKLVDVRPSGLAQLINDGIVRGRYATPTGREVRLKAGRIYEFSIDLWSTSNVFKRGHRIRVDISSSNFPKFDRNFNSGGPVAEETEPVVAVQQVFHDSGHPSHLLLPVVPR